MPNNTPTLGEITSIKGDANIGAGTAGAGGDLAQLPADYQAIQVLQNAAIQKAAANKFALESHQQTLKDNLANFNTLSVDGIMEKDYNSILPEYEKLIGDIYQNYDVIADPSRNRERYDEIKQQEGVLRGKIARSKQDVLLRNSGITFLSQHKGFDNEESLNKIKQFNDAPLGQRDPSNVIDFVPSWDFKQDEISKLANLSAQQKTTAAETNKKFITTTDRINYNKQAYNDAVATMLNGADEYNRPIINGIKQQFDKQPDQVKAQYMNPDGSYDVVKYGIDKYYAPLRAQDSSSVKVNENQFALNDQNNKARLAEIYAQAAEQRKNLLLQKKYEEKDYDYLAGDLAIKQRSIFGAPDQPNAQVEAIPPPTGTDKGKLYEPMNKFQNTFGFSKDQGNVSEGVPVPLDATLVNAYSIPGKTVNTYDPETGKMLSHDNFIRPEKAWVTNEKDPNSRRVVIRYNDEETGKTSDLILPYTEHFQILNNIMGPANAVKLGGARAKLMKSYFGTINPSYETLGQRPEFNNPNTQAQPVAVPAAGTSVGVSASPTAIPQNQTTGGFILNADEFLKANKKKK